MKPKRISIIGQNGSGKTTLARELAKKFPYQIVHMDTFIWGPNWKENDRDQAEQKVQELLRTQSEWIAEGYITYADREMLELADLVLYLDYSKTRSFFNNIKRWMKHRNIKREELPEGCEERFNLKSWLRMLRQSGVKQLIEEALQKYPPKNMVRVKSPRKMKKFTESF